MTPVMEVEQKGAPAEEEKPLTPQQRSLLLRVAHDAVVSATKWEEPDSPMSNDPRLMNKQGAFVTLRTSEESLRGCIGFVESHLPLIETVSMAAHSAASRDPRFSPVKKEELANLHIEISVLSPLQQLKDVSELVVGKHGLVISDGPMRGLLLPQVAEKQGWEAERFLEETCRKAGIGRERWKSPQVRIEIFSAEIFTDEPPRGK